MYFPYLRGKQFEQLALIETNQAYYDNQKLLPIFEPIDTSNAGKNRYARMCNGNKPFILIVNPAVVDGPSQANVMAQIVNHADIAPFNNFKLGYLVDGGTTNAQLQAFMALSPAHAKVFIHRGEYTTSTDFHAINANVDYHIFKRERVTDTYVNSVSNGTSKVLLKDGFNRQDRNADYNGPEVFFDLHNTYHGLGFDGFGDYQMIGDNFRRGGGPAYAVALHLTSERGNNLIMNHYVSDRTTGAGDVAGKFGEALNHLINDVPNLTIANTGGLQEFHNLHGTGHFPNLGPAKKLSLIHHIEQICSII